MRPNELTTASRIAVALRGLKGAGKSHLACTLVREIGWPVLETGQAVREWALATHRVANAETVRLVADEARRAPGGVMAKILRTSWPSQLPPKRLIIDSVREPADVNTLREAGYFVVVITVFASFDDRLLRVHNRHRSDDVTAIAELRAQDAWERRLARGLRGDIHMRVKSGDIHKILPRLVKQMRERGITDEC